MRNGIRYVGTAIIAGHQVVVLLILAWRYGSAAIVSVPVLLPACVFTLWGLCESWSSGRNVIPVRQGSIACMWLPVFSGMTVLAGMIFALAGAATTESSLVATASGTVALCTGGALRVIAIRQLGSCFQHHVCLGDQHRLITTGLYSHMRHPSEAGLLLILSGLVIISGSAWVMLAILLPGAGLSLFRMRVEDKMLADHFGSSFVAYRKQVPACFPNRTLFAIGTDSA